MNIECDQIIRSQKAEEAAAGGLDVFRRKALRHLKLKTVIRESHCSPVRQLRYNHTCEHNNNLFVTVGKDQATVYDDRHVGDYVAVVAQYQNERTEYNPGGDLKACAWVHERDNEDGAFSDCRVAVAGQGTIISIISLAATSVIAQLKVEPPSQLTACSSKPLKSDHSLRPKGGRGGGARGGSRQTGLESHEVLDLCTCPAHPSLLLSLSKGGFICIWDIASATCLTSFTCQDAIAMALHPNGQSFLTVGKGVRNQLQEWDLHVTEGDQGIEVPEQPHSSKCELPVERPPNINAIQFVGGNRFVVGTVAGAMASWHWGEPRKYLAKWRVPGRDKEGVLAQQAFLFSATQDGDLICAGSQYSHVYVFDTNTGQQLHHVKVGRVSGPVVCCGLSNDCRHLLVALGNGFVFRFEHMASSAATEPEDDDTDNPGANNENQGGGDNSDGMDWEPEDEDLRPAGKRVKAAA